MTTTQPDLFAGLTRADDPETSVEAARKITGRTEQRILLFFERNQRYDRIVGCTDDELADWLRDIFPATLKSARSRLSNKGVLVDSGERRPSSRGVPMVVWRLA